MDEETKKFIKEDAKWKVDHQKFDDDNQLKNDDRFTKIDETLKKSASDRDEKHTEILQKINDLSLKVEPVSKAFETSKEMSVARMKMVMSASQYLYFFLKVAAIFAIAWTAFKFGVMNITK